MVEVNQRLLMVVCALAIVCLLSIGGSFAAWACEQMDHRADYNRESQINRWKWMVIVFFIILSFMLMGAK